jgi:uncharacterized protein (TIGR04255 family)
MALPAYPRLILSKSPLRLVICQVQFSQILRVATDPSLVAAFQDVVSREYPKLSKEQQLSFQISPQGVQNAAGDTLWRFRSRDGAWAVVLGPSAITLEARSGYRDGEDLIGRFSTILRAAQEVLGLSDRTRLGLRYINELRHPTAETLTDWQRFVRTDLIQAHLQELLEGDIQQTFQETQNRRPDGVFTIRHGLLTGTTVPPINGETVPQGKFYLLDLDYFDQAEKPLDIDATLVQIRNFNDVLYRFFRWSLTDAALAHFEARDAR